MNLNNFNIDYLNPVNLAVKQLRRMVSGDKKRFIENDIDLDLTYITENIIAMGFPAEDYSIESAYRNSITDVALFLNRRHRDHYQIYNLTIEGSYDYNKFENRVVAIGWADHHAPTIEKLVKNLNSIDTWLKASPENVVAVHCKAGRGRTGCVIASYLLWIRQLQSPEEALKMFAEVRSKKGEGVGVPSQKRYVRYIHSMIHKNLNPFPPKPLLLQKLLMLPIPSFSIEESCIPSLELIDLGTNSVIFFSDKSQLKEFKKNDGCAIIDNINTTICGDIMLRVYHQLSVDVRECTRNYMMFRVQFHSSFIENHILDLPLSEIDSPTQGRLRDRRFSNDFSVRIVFADVPVTNEAVETAPVNL